MGKKQYRKQNFSNTDGIPGARTKANNS